MKITPEFRQAAIRHGFVATPKSQNTPADVAVAYTAALEMANLGFRVSPDALAGLSVSVLEDMISDARVVIGADRNMKPVYPGFPKQVQELDTLTLIFEQILHYWTAGAFMPNYSDVERDGLPLEDMARATRALEVLPAVDVAKKLVKSLTQSNIALSEGDKELLAGSVAMCSPSVSDVASVLSGARHGENMQTLILTAKNKCLAKTSSDDLVKAFVPTAKNADQLLRIVLATCSRISGDISNPRHAKGYVNAVEHLSDKDHRALSMNSLSRPARRAVLNRLAVLTDGFNADSLVARRMLWQRVMKMMHPYSVKMDSAVADKGKRALDVIHENIEYRTFNSLVEDAIANKDVATAVDLLAENQPGNLLRRLVALLRLCSTKEEATAIASAVKNVGANSKVSTLISAYNGILSVNDSTAKLTRVAGENNTLVSNKDPKDKDENLVPLSSINVVLSAVEGALVSVLSRKDAPASAVGTKSENPVPLVRRDAATTDRVMDRGERLTPAGDGDTVRIFGHWRNNQNRPGYMDCGAVVLDEDFEAINTITWDSWAGGRDWATYSGDKNVSPGDDAAEYIDVNMPKLRESLPAARWVAMTIQSWSGFVTKNVDMLAGIMLRSQPDSGEVFDPRSVVTAFKPTTESLQSVPFVVDVKTGDMIWIDSSNGSTMSGVSAKNDDTVGVVVYNEIQRPRMTMGELAGLWAQAHGVETTEDNVDRDNVLALVD